MIVIVLTVCAVLFDNDGTDMASADTTPARHDESPADRSPAPRSRGPPTDRCELSGRRFQSRPARVLVESEPDAPGQWRRRVRTDDVTCSRYRRASLSPCSAAMR